MFNANERDEKVRCELTKKAQECYVMIQSDEFSGQCRTSSIDPSHHKLNRLGAYFAMRPTSSLTLSRISLRTSVVRTRLASTSSSIFPDEAAVSAAGSSVELPLRLKAIKLYKEVSVVISPNPALMPFASELEDKAERMLMISYIDSAEISALPITIPKPLLMIVPIRLTISTNVCEELSKVRQSWERSDQAAE